jgi:hypothetical protein
VFLALCGIGVGIADVRDACATLRLDRIEAAGDAAPIPFDEVRRTVLVTGATGFIGQRLVRALLREGHDVIALTRQPRRCAWLFDGKLRCIESMSALPPTFAVDVIINLAGARILGWRWTAARKKTLRQSRIGTTRSLVPWTDEAERKPWLLLSASAVGYYGIQEIGEQTALDEAAPPLPASDAGVAAAADAGRTSRSAGGRAAGNSGEAAARRFRIPLSRCRVCAAEFEMSGMAACIAVNLRADGYRFNTMFRSHRQTAWKHGGSR